MKQRFAAILDAIKENPESVFLILAAVIFIAWIVWLYAALVFRR